MTAAKVEVAKLRLALSADAGFDKQESLRRKTTIAKVFRSHSTDGIITGSTVKNRMGEMRKKDAFNRIAKSLEENLRDYGFVYRKSDGRILRFHPNGFDVILIDVLDYWPVFEVRTFLCIRLEEVENIVNMFIPNFNPKFMKYSTTIATSYMVLSGADSNEIEFETEEELDAAISTLTMLIKDKGLKYFDEHRSLEVVNRIKKEQIIIERNESYNVINNLMQSIVLMYLCNDPDFDTLCAEYKKIYIPFLGEEELGNKALDDLIHYLSTARK